MEGAYLFQVSGFERGWWLDKTLLTHEQNMEIVRCILKKKIFHNFNAISCKSISKDKPNPNPPIFFFFKDLTPACKYAQWLKGGFLIMQYHFN